MLLKVNCQRYAYKLSLSHPAPLPLIQRHKKWVGKGWGSWLPPTACWLLNGALFASLPITSVKAFSICSVKASFLPSFNGLHQKQRPSNENDSTSMPTHPSRIRSLLPFVTQAKRSTQGPPWLLSAVRGCLSALSCNKKTRTYLELPD